MDKTATLQIKTPFVLWFTGLSGSGKTTIALSLKAYLDQKGHQSVILDGDRIRKGLCSDLGFSSEDRDENIRRAAEVTKLFFENGITVLATFISPFSKHREFARKLFPNNRFIEVYVQCSLEKCIQRDPKKMYVKALKGEIADFTGISSPYEEPSNPEITINSENVSVDEAIQKIISFLFGALVVTGD